MSRLTPDGTAEPVSRDQVLRRERGQRNINFPCSAHHEQDWQPYPFDPYPYYPLKSFSARPAHTAFPLILRLNHVNILFLLFFFAVPLKHELITFVIARRNLR